MIIVSYKPLNMIVRSVTHIGIGPHRQVPPVKLHHRTFSNMHQNLIQWLITVALHIHMERTNA